jgi:PAS domain S-box-containing protein
MLPLNHPWRSSFESALPSRRSSSAAKAPRELPDYRSYFERAPIACAVLDTAFRIVAATDQFCRATFTTRKDIVGHSIFEAFPDNPEDYSANGVEQMRESLLAVLKTRATHGLNRQRHDIRRAGTFERHLWNAANAPILGDDGFVKWILFSVEDITPAFEATPVGARAAN